MDENAEIITCGQPEPKVETQAAATEATTPREAAQEILIPVKFNKETKNLTADEAANLAQKGMKFEMIADDYERIKRLAGMDGRSVCEFINALEEHRKNEKKKELTEKCGGNEKIAEHIIELENRAIGGRDSGFDELHEQFPEITDESLLPSEVLERAKTKGTSLLDEYLRYRLRAERAEKSAVRRQKNAVMASVGSQRELTSPENPEATEFLKGLWSR